MNRSARVVPASVVALLLFAGALFGAVETVTRLGHRAGWAPTESISTWVASTRWDSPGWTLASVVLAALGLWLLLLAVLPGHGSLVRLGSDDPHVDAATTRRSLRRAVAAAVEQVDGVDSAETQLRGHRITVTAVTNLADTTDLVTAAEDAAQQRLGVLAPARPLRVRARVRRRRSDLPQLESARGPEPASTSSGGDEFHHGRRDQQNTRELNGRRYRDEGP